jgi:hypothetical protein
MAALDFSVAPWPAHSLILHSLVLAEGIRLRARITFCEVFQSTSAPH